MESGNSCGCVDHVFCRFPSKVRVSNPADEVLQLLVDEFGIDNFIDLIFGFVMDDHGRWGRLDFFFFFFNINNAYPPLRYDAPMVRRPQGLEGGLKGKARR